MSIDGRTRAFLALADENYSLAVRLLNDPSPPLRWVAVVAFYAAVHYVGAYVWELDKRELSSHPERDNEIHRDPALRRIAPHYRLLFDHGFRGRYKAYYKADFDEVAQFIHTDLAAIEACVRENLRHR